MVFLFLIIPIILFSVIFFAISNNDKKLSEDNKAFTEISIKLLIGVFLSIIISVIIALQKDIPASSGHGGFIYIIGPVLLGLLVLFLYLISLVIKPKKRILMGIIAIATNLLIGLYFSVTDF